MPRTWKRFYVEFELRQRNIILYLLKKTSRSFCGSKMKNIPERVLKKYSERMK